jgi:hypothetical protein
LSDTTLIKRVLDDGLIAAWNKENDDLISPGAEILKVNDCQGLDIFGELKRGGELVMTIELHCDKMLPAHLQPTEQAASRQGPADAPVALGEVDSGSCSGIIDVVVNTRTASDSRLGIMLESATSTVIRDVLHFGALHEWNEQNGRVIEAGARIEEVNGAHGSDIRAQLRAGGELRMRINLQPREASQFAQPVPLPPRAEEPVKAEAAIKPSPKTKSVSAAKVKSRFVFGGWCGKPEPEPISLPEPEREPDVVASQHEPASALMLEVSQAPPEPIKPGHANVAVPVAEAEAGRTMSKKKPKKGKMGIC